MLPLFSLCSSESYNISVSHVLFIENAYAHKNCEKISVAKFRANIMNKICIVTTIFAIINPFLFPIFWIVSAQGISKINLKNI